MIGHTFDAALGGGCHCLTVNSGGFELSQSAVTIDGHHFAASCSHCTAAVLAEASYMHASMSCCNFARASGRSDAHQMHMAHSHARADVAEVLCVRLTLRAPVEVLCRAQVLKECLWVLTAA